MKRTYSVLVFMVFMFSMVGSTTFGGILYVDDDSLGGDGLSWGTAFKYLQDAIAISEPNDEIRVAQGTYIPNYDYVLGWGFRPSERTSLFGGYAGLGAVDPNQRDIERFRTVISGDVEGDDLPVSDASKLKDDSLRDDNRSSLVNINGNMDQNDVVLDGFEFYGAHGYGAMWIGYGTATIQNCAFIENYTDITELGQAGAINAIWQNHASDTPLVRVIGCRFERNASKYSAGAILGTRILIEDCEFVGNYAKSDGGALDLQSGCVVEGCQFMENRSLRYGGAIYSNRSIQINRCQFQENNASIGGAVFLSEDADIRECSFLGNTSLNGGGLYCDGYNNYLANCCFYGNQAEEYGGGVFAPNGQWELVNCSSGGNKGFKGNFLAAGYSSSHNAIVSITNCVVVDEKWLCNEGSTVEINYSNIVNKPTIENDPNLDVDWGVGNIQVAPCFVDSGYWDTNDTPDDPNDDFYVAGDYHLKSQAGHWDAKSKTWICDGVTSLCIDAGDPNSLIMYEPFPNGGRINMGAYGGMIEASKSYFGCSPCEIIIAGDINGDCKVNYLDLAILASHWLE